MTRFFPGLASWAVALYYKASYCCTRLPSAPPLPAGTPAVHPTPTGETPAGHAPGREKEIQSAYV